MIGSQNRNAATTTARCAATFGCHIDARLNALIKRLLLGLELVKDRRQCAGVEKQQAVRSKKEMVGVYYV